MFISSSFYERQASLHLNLYEKKLRLMSLSLQSVAVFFDDEKCWEDRPATSVCRNEIVQV